MPSLHHRAAASPLIVTPANSPLPTLDSTRLLARYAVREAVDERPIPIGSGWLTISDGRASSA
jgi:hypothetical protein